LTDENIACYFGEEHAFAVIGDLKWERREWTAVVFVLGSGCFELRLLVCRMKAWKVGFWPRVESVVHSWVKGLFI
jgi:hypothetical protein